MTRRYTGGLLSATEQPTDATTANGIYTVQEAGAKIAQGAFPSARFNPQGSMRLRQSASTYLSRLPATTSGNSTWTYSCWFKLNTYDQTFHIISGNGTTSGGTRSMQTFEISSGGQFSAWGFNNSSGYGWNRFSTELFRDPAAWYHCVIWFDADNSTAARRIRVWMNGRELTWSSSADSGAGGNWSNYRLINSNTGWGNAIGGSYQGGGAPVYFADGYMAEMTMISGSLVDPSNFHSIDASTGMLIPKKYTGSYGTNGFYLVPTVGNLAYDLSGNSNNWSANNMVLSGTDADFGTPDVPGIGVTRNVDPGGVILGNYATLNPLYRNILTPNGGMLNFGTSSDGGSTDGNSSFIQSTMAVTSGKWYFETKKLNTTSNCEVPTWMTTNFLPGDNVATGVNRGVYGFKYGGSGNYYATVIDGNNQNNTVTYGGQSQNDVHGVALDLDNNYCIAYKNGVPSPKMYFSPPKFPVTVGLAQSASWNYPGFAFNFGQKTWAYAPPPGFKGLCNTNLPEPAIKKPSDHFDQKTWVGAYSTLTVGAVNKQTSSYQIPGSTLFKGGNSAYMTRSVATTGNTSTYSFSAWFKLPFKSSAQREALFNAGETGGDGNAVHFFLDWSGYSQGFRMGFISGGGTYQVAWNAPQFAENSQWHHVLFVSDTTQAPSQQRWRCWLDGVEMSNSTTALTGGSAAYPPQNWASRWNASGYTQKIGISNDGGDAYPLTAYLAEVYNIDGSAKSPTDFGQFDANNNWVPKAYTGSYGTNGFYLPMNTRGGSGFSIATWRGNGGSSTSGNSTFVSGLGFSPDLIWIKGRTNTRPGAIVDTVRGIGTGRYKSLTPSNADGETSTETYSGVTGGVITIDSDGFQVKARSGWVADNYNATGEGFVAWCWDAGTTTVSNTAGTITSSVRANTTYGTSIVTWTGNGVTGATVGHGLGAVPALIICKETSVSGDYWHVKHKSTASNTNLYLNQTLASTAAAAVGDGVLADLSSSTTFGFATAGSPNNVVAVNENGVANVAYCFAEVAGFSKFGTYTGNAAAGNSVNLGFRPALVMIKRTDSTGSWYMWDSTRGENSYYMTAESTNYESDVGNYITFTATGFSTTGNYANNYSGATYVYMAWADTRAAQMWKDLSGNANHFLPNRNMGTNDCMVDSPTDYTVSDDNVDNGAEVRGNYPVLQGRAAYNNSYPWSVATGYDATLKASMSYAGPQSTLSMTKGKWYWEVLSEDGTAAYNPRIGIMRKDMAIPSGTSLGDIIDTYAYDAGGQKSDGLGYVSYGSTYADQDVIGIALDLDNGKIWFSKNGTWQASGDPAAGTNAAYTTIPIANKWEWCASVGTGGAGGGYQAVFNFGAKPFRYTPPTGFKSLNSKNLRDVNSNLPDTWGNSVNSPDLVVIKSNSTATGWLWSDSVRGPGLGIYTNSTASNAFDAGQITQFLPNGFALGATGDVNFLNRTYAAWMWNKGTVPGFNIVRWAGNGVASRGIEHGLGVTPAFAQIKVIEGTTESWATWHKGLLDVTGDAYFWEFNAASAAGTGNSRYPRAPDNRYVYVGSSGNLAPVNAANCTYIGYFWSEVPGFSKFDTWKGNSSANGPFIHTGFKPKLVYYKKITANDGNNEAGRWYYDPNGYSVGNGVLSQQVPSSADTQSTNTPDMDFLSNGIKIRTSWNGANGGTSDYFAFMAFADVPFKYATAR
jgi:hypothetical protein